MKSLRMAGLGIALLLAQQVSAARLSGVVVDERTGRPLSGVKVTVVGKGATQITDRSGRFVFADVQGADTKVRLEYLGYHSQELAADLNADVKLDVTLKSEVYELEAATIRTQLKGQARALNEEMNSDNLRNIVAADQIGRFPDQNAAEAISRVPSVGLQRDQGEGRYVQIRGTQPRLTSVKINGQEVPSPEGDIRSVALDVIPSDQLSSIEISKALTPEMDGDAIGGQVDLKMLKAQSLKPEFTVSVGGGYNAEMESFKNFDGSASYGQRFGKDGAFGVLLSAGYLTRHFGSDNMEMEYGKLAILDSNLTWDEDEQDSIRVEVDDLKAYESIELRDYEITRSRLSANLNLDWRLAPGSDLSWNTTMNRYSDQEYRRRLTYNFADGELVANELGKIDGVELERELKDRYEVQDIVMSTLGGRHLLGSVLLDYAGTFSYAQEAEPDAYYTTYKGKGDFAPIENRGRFPRLAALEGADIHNPEDYEWDEFSAEDNKTIDRNWIGSMNLEFPLSSDLGWTLKAGGKYRAKSKERDNKATAWEWDAESDPITMDQDKWADKQLDNDFLLGKYTGVGPMANPDNHRDFIKTYADSLASEEDLEDNNVGDYEAKENVIAGYMQTRLELGAWMFLGGARYEYTDLEFTGRQVNLDDETVSKVEGSNDYGHLLPSFHVRYNPWPKANLRASYSKSIARPDFYDLVPYVLTEDDEMSIGNPDLKASEASNVDLSFAHYFQSVGTVSLGYYYKWIDGLIYETVTEETIGDTDFEVLQKVNGTWGEVHGLEASWNQQFTFLPGALAGLGVYSNYNFAWSEAEVPARDTRTDLPGQSAHTANAALSFERWGFGTRLAWNYQSAFLDAVGAEADEDIYYDQSHHLDLSVSQQIGKKITVFAEMSNLTNQPLRYYQGSKDKVIQQEYYGITTGLGVKASF
jgi:TonB-dependent receptor